MTSRMSNSGRARHFAVAAFAAALTLTACGNSTQPQAEQSASPTVSTSATATASTTPMPSAAYKPADAKGKAQNVPVPVLPEAAKANSKEGVEAFARYWFQVLSYAYETGNTDDWSPKTASQCVFCASLKNGLDSGYSKGRWLVGGKMTTPSIRAQYKPQAPSQQVEIQTIQDQIDYFEADGSISQSSTPPSNSATVMVAVFESGSWRVSDLGLIR